MIPLHEVPFNIQEYLCAMEERLLFHIQENRASAENGSRALAEKVDALSDVTTKTFADHAQRIGTIERDMRLIYTTAGGAVLGIVGLVVEYLRRAFLR